jgi:hypothetical protein
MSRQTTVFHRAAVAIHERQCLFDGHPSLSPPTESWSECYRLTRLIEKARRRNLFAAVSRMEAALAAAIQRVTTALHDYERAAVAMRNRSPSTIRDILADFDAIASEFDKVSISVERHLITVTTDEVVLEEVYLGSFEIVLNWHRLNETGAYEVIAADARPAATDDDTTHPHVQSNALCEGEGKAAIRNALRDGRLYDFFVLVRQILHTYNPASAYVQLSDWSGISCPECGSTTAEDDSNLCEDCSTTTCIECSTRCNDCDYRYCSDCIRTCTGCDKDTCSSCRSVCSECGDAFCKGCLINEICLLCHENETEETQPEAVVATQAPTV